jgi:hypothetical protein
MWIGKFLIFRDNNYLISDNKFWIMIDYYESYLYTSDTLFNLFLTIFKEW